MPDETPAPSPRDAALRARQKSSVLLACTLLTLVAIALLVLPLDKLPRLMRVGLAALDFIVAATLWLVARQKFKE
jgi:hypothetical protein